MFQVWVKWQADSEWELFSVAFSLTEAQADTDQLRALGAYDYARWNTRLGNFRKE